MSHIFGAKKTARMRGNERMQFAHKLILYYVGGAALRGGDVIVVIGPEKERQSKDVGKADQAGLWVAVAPSSLVAAVTE